MRRRIPRAAALPAQGLGFGAIFIALPLALSRAGRRHGWSEGRPGPSNVLGVLPVCAGSGLMIWAMSCHYRAAPGGWEVRLTPDYLLEGGPYSISRNPMYVGEAAIWSGWAVFFGSAPVTVGLVAYAAAWTGAIRLEERALGRRFGGAYDSYKARVPRWIGLRPRSRQR